MTDEASFAKQKKYSLDHLLHFIDSLEEFCMQKLFTLKPLIQPQLYSLLQADLKAETKGTKFQAVETVYNESIEATLAKRKTELTPASQKYLENIFKFDSSLSYSYSYINQVYTILYMDYHYRINEGKSGKSLLDKYEYLNSHLPSSLKTQILTIFLEDYLKELVQTERIEMLITKTFTSTKDSLYKRFITRRYNDMTSLKKGIDAPGFVLQDENGKNVSLASLKGKVVFLDFWFKDCIPCHGLFEVIKPVKEKFKHDDIVFLNISIDRKEVWQKALKQYNIAGSHVFTENKEANHSVIKAYNVKGYPTTYLIDRNGKLFSATPSNDADELEQQIKEALLAGNK